MKFERDVYNAIDMHSVKPAIVKQVNNLFRLVKNSEKIDEHGNWNFGIEEWGKGFVSLNYSFYGISKDFHSRRLLVVVQIRQCSQRKTGHFKNVKKSYFLIGRNEDNTGFAHPVSANVVHSAINKGKDVCKACQDWIFGYDYRYVLRQGDVSLVPLKTKAILSGIQSQFNIRFNCDKEGSHICTAEELKKKENIYVKNPSLIHLPGTHPNFENLKGWFKVVLGKRGRFHDFAVPTID